MSKSLAIPWPLTRHKIRRLKFARVSICLLECTSEEKISTNKTRKSDGRSRVYRKSGELFAEGTLAQNVSFGCASTMLWCESHRKLFQQNFPMNNDWCIQNIIEEHFIHHLAFKYHEDDELAALV